MLGCASLACMQNVRAVTVATNCCLLSRALLFRMSYWSLCVHLWSVVRCVRLTCMHPLGTIFDFHLCCLLIRLDVQSQDDALNFLMLTVDSLCCLCRQGALKLSVVTDVGTNSFGAKNECKYTWRRCAMWKPYMQRCHIQEAWYTLAFLAIVVDAYRDIH